MGVLKKRDTQPVEVQPLQAVLRVTGGQIYGKTGGSNGKIWEKHPENAGKIQGRTGPEMRVEQV